MAKLLGGMLPDEVLNKIKEEQSKPASNEILLLCSLDKEGFANVSLLSFLDVSILSEKALLLAVGAKSSTKQNLVRAKRGTLVLWVDRSSGVFYIKGKIKLIANQMHSFVEGFRCSALNFTIEKVSQDYSATVQILSTLTYDPSRTNASHRRLFQELRKLSTL